MREPALAAVENAAAGTSESGMISACHRVVDIREVQRIALAVHPSHDVTGVLPVVDPREHRLDLGRGWAPARVEELKPSAAVRRARCRVRSSGRGMPSRLRAEKAAVNRPRGPGGVSAEVGESDFPI